MQIAIIGSGLSGLTAAYVIKQFDSKINITIYEKEEKIGGNCKDTFINNTDYIQNFGPHIFHTNQKYIWNFLNFFSEFNLYQHKVLSYVNGELVNFPLLKDFVVNYDKTILDRLQTENKFDNAEDYLYYILGEELTNSFFKNYSEKQWGIQFTELPIEVVKRIPIRNNNDPRYFTDKYQGVPKLGYSNLFKNIIKTIKVNIIRNKEIKYDNIKDKYDVIINTGETDSFFSYKFGELEYRSVLFKFIRNLKSQPTSVINYPNDYDFTRITEYNHFFNSSYFGLEYPVSQQTSESVKCYPIFWKDENKQKFIKYKQYSEKNNVLLLGRMGMYQYLNMDTAIDLVFSSLTQFNSLQLKEKLQNDFTF